VTENNVMLSVGTDSRKRIRFEVEASLPGVCCRGRDSSLRARNDNLRTLTLFPAVVSRYTGFQAVMETREFITRSPEETIALGSTLAEMLTPPKIVVLRGDLGAGKTTLVKGIAEGFHAASEEDVTSPTFTLIHEYRGPEAILYHIDLYRVDTPRQLETLGLDDLIAENSVLLIEWGEKFARFERERDVEIALERVGENERRVRVSSRR
jgi:tRNA threonylcarbamoyladenosine biosynthesis protein TsaE